MEFAPLSVEIALRALRGVLVIAGWAVLFVWMRPPRSKWRLAALWVLFFIGYGLWQVWVNLTDIDSSWYQTLWSAIIIGIALVAAEQAADIPKTLFRAFYYIFMEQIIDTLRAALAATITGRTVQSHLQSVYRKPASATATNSPPSCAQQNKRL